MSRSTFYQFSVLLLLYNIIYLVNSSLLGLDLQFIGWWPLDVSTVGYGQFFQQLCPPNSNFNCDVQACK